MSFVEEYKCGGVTASAVSYFQVSCKHEYKLHNTKEEDKCGEVTCTLFLLQRHFQNLTNFINFTNFRIRNSHLLFILAAFAVMLSR